MTTIIEFLIYSTISGFWTALVLIINDRLFKKQIEKIIDMAEKELKEKIKKGIKNESK